MATRISGNSGLSGQALIQYLKRKAPKRESSANFIGLQRASALSDVKDPQASLNNILDKISITEVSERNQYKGPYNALDLEVTRDFVDERINKSFLSALYDSSVGGGSLGSTVSITPRIRIQDRINFLNSFYGEGSFSGLHSGPDAQFYKEPYPEHIGFIKFSFNSGTGVVSVNELKGPDGLTNINPADILGNQPTVVLDLDEYETTEANFINISGFSVSLRLDSPNSWSVYGNRTVARLIGIENSTKINNISTFSNLKFKLIRPYSYVHKPLWFTQSPNDGILPGGADDINPSTSNKILKNENGVISSDVEKGYWYSKAYVESRWIPDEILSLTSFTDAILVEDSNMRWQEPPGKLRSQVYNWGIRWDGYLLMTAGNYAFEVQTNVSIKIDMALGSDKSWVNVFDNDENSVKESEDKYISSSTFNTDSLHSSFKYVYGSGTNDWTGYVPITIRLYYGAPDKAFPENFTPDEPNLFVKTTRLNSAAQFYSKEYEITLTGTDGNWSVSSDDSTEIIEIVQDTLSSVNYQLTGEGDSIFVQPIDINLSTDGVNITSDTTGLSATTYTLTISPLRPSEFNVNLSALWKGRVASPSTTYQKYTDLTDGSYEPNLKKLSFDFRPEWWKVSEGHPYFLNEPPGRSNTPIGGFIPNSFKDTLRSYAEGVGLYGDGANPVTYSNRPNIIFGEARYSVGDELGSNYISLRLTPNSLGEGGKLDARALPVNNVETNDSTLLDQNDLGGSPNHLTAANGKISSNIIRLFLPDSTVTPSSERFNKYYTVLTYGTLGDFPVSGVSGVIYLDDSTGVFYEWNSSYVVKTDMVSDDPTSYGLPSFSSNDWLSPITVFVSRVADDQALTVNSTYLTAVLTLTVEKVTFGSFDLLQFSTTQPSLLRPGGVDINAFNGKYVEFYTEDNVAFQYLSVDDGRSLSFPDVLKLTYNGSNQFQGIFSEVPRPPSDRVTPFGFDKPEFSGGICYPPYAINNPLLSSVAIDDDPASGLYTQPEGNYDVFWGYPGEPELGNKILELTEKIEFQNFDGNAVEELITPVSVRYEDYTHRLKIEFPLSGTYDEDMLEHIGSGEKVKDSYYAYVEL